MREKEFNYLSLVLMLFYLASGFRGQIPLPSRSLLSRKLVMLIDIGSLPRVADPNIPHGSRSAVSVLVQHVIGQMSFLLFILVL